jgi:hypothetical protein
MNHESHVVRSNFEQVELLSSFEISTKNTDKNNASEEKLGIGKFMIDLMGALTNALALENPQPVLDFLSVNNISEMRSNLRERICFI